MFSHNYKAKRNQKWGRKMNERKDFSYRSHSNQNASQNQNLSPISPLNIKVLVEIANSIIELNLSKKIKMSSQVIDIQDITWAASPVDYQINLLADKLWISGKLTAELTYTKRENPNVLQQYITIPWKKTCSLEYLYPPIPPIHDEKKHFTFNTLSGMVTDHYEQILHHNEPPILEIVLTKIITSKNCIKENNHSYLMLDINCEFYYRLYQNQVVKKK